MEELVKKAKMGDGSSLYAIIQKFIPFIFKQSSKYVIKGYDFEDLVQHGYLSVIKAIKMFENRGKKFTPYCMQAIKLNYRALLKGEIKHHREVPEEKDIYAYDFTLEDEVLAYEKMKALYEALDKLSLNEKRIINNFYFKNMTMKQIALDCNSSYNRIRYEKDKIIKKLKRLLKEHI